MDLIDIPYPQLKILFINIFSILYKAATLNVYKLQADLKEVKYALKNSSDILGSQVLIFLISLLVMAKFLFGYITLAANVVAIFPILSDNQPDLLLPSIFAQAVENILLCLIELMLGYITCTYYMPEKMAMFTFFVVKSIIKMSLSVKTLNLYSDLYNQLKFPIISPSTVLPSESSFAETGLNEQFVRKQILS